MSWSPLALSSPVSSSKPAVRVGCTVAGGRFRQALIVTFDRDAMDTPPDWLAIGYRADVLIGHGEHAGWIRLVPGKQVSMSTAGGRHAKTSLVLLRLIGFPGLPAQAWKTKEVEFDHAEGWIEIKMPGWAAPAAPAVAAPAVAPAPVTRASGLALAKQPHTTPGVRAFAR